MEIHGRNRVKQPAFFPQEMADIIAYLIQPGHAGDPDDSGRGKIFFVQKQCNLCLGKGHKTLDLTLLKGRIFAFFMVEAIWNHGPKILKEMRKTKVPWQNYDGREMAELKEYLNGRMP